MLLAIIYHRKPYQYAGITIHDLAEGDAWYYARKRWNPTDASVEFMESRYTTQKFEVASKEEAEAIYKLLVQ